MTDEPPTLELPLWAGLPPVPDPPRRSGRVLAAVVLALLFLAALAAVVALGEEIAWKG